MFKKEKFSIRKLNVGVGSVVIASALFIFGGEVSAADNNVENKESNTIAVEKENKVDEKLENKEQNIEVIESKTNEVDIAKENVTVIPEKKTKGYKAENTLPDSSTNSLANSGKNDLRNGKAIPRGEQLLTPETGLTGNVTTVDELKQQITNNNANIILSNNLTSNETIMIPNTYTGKIHGNGYTIGIGATIANLFNVEGGVTFDSITLDGNSKGRLIWTSGDKANVVVKDSTVKNGVSFNATVGDQGGAIHGGGIYAINGATLTINDSTFKDNKAVPLPTITDKNTNVANGGAIFASNNVSVTVTNSTFENNAVVGTGDSIGNGGGGGAIYITGSKNLDISGSTFTGNHNGQISEAGNQGGAVRVRQTPFTSTNNTYTIAKTFNTGGAIYAYGSKVVIKNDTYKIPNLGDQYGIAGGLITSDSNDMTIEDSNFSSESWSKVNHEGGMIQVVGPGTFTMKNSSLVGQGSWWQSPSMATFGGVISFSTGNSVKALIENTTIKNASSDATGGAITISTRKGETSSTNLTLKNVEINNTRSSYGHGGGIYVGPGNTLTIDGGSIQNSFAPRGGGISNDGTVIISGENTTNISNNTAYQYGGGIYNDGVLKVDTASFNGNYKVAGYGGNDENVGKVHDYAGGTIYAKKDVIVTPKAIFDITDNGRDIRVFDKQSAIILTGTLTKPINVSISESAGGNDNETQHRFLGYIVAKGEGAYIPTESDAQLLHYLTRDTNDASARNVHNDLGKWDYVLNPETNDIVLGQRVKIIYHVNADDAKFADNSKDKDRVLTVYKTDWTPTGIEEKPTREGYRFTGWYKEAATTNEFTLSKSLFNLPDGEITALINNPHTVEAYAGWAKEIAKKTRHLIVGTNVEISPEEDGFKDYKKGILEKDGKNYVYSGATEQGYINSSAKLTDPKDLTIHWYREVIEAPKEEGEIAKVTVFVDEKDNKLKDPVFGKEFVEKEPIENYVFKETKPDTEDTRTHVYTKVVIEIPNDAPKEEKVELKTTRHLIEGTIIEIADPELDFKAAKAEIIIKDGKQYQYSGKTDETSDLRTHWYKEVVPQPNPEPNPNPNPQPNPEPNPNPNPQPNPEPTPNITPQPEPIPVPEPTPTPAVEQGNKVVTKENTKAVLPNTGQKENSLAGLGLLAGLMAIVLRKKSTK